jgi:hypothetical protein
VPCHCRLLDAGSEEHYKLALEYKTKADALRDEIASGQSGAPTCDPNSEPNLQLQLNALEKTFNEDRSKLSDAHELAAAAAPAAPAAAAAAVEHVMAANPVIQDPTANEKCQEDAHKANAEDSIQEHAEQARVRRGAAPKLAAQARERTACQKQLSETKNAIEEAVLAEDYARAVPLNVNRTAQKRKLLQLFNAHGVAPDAEATKLLESPSKPQKKRVSFRLATHQSSIAAADAAAPAAAVPAAPAPEAAAAGNGDDAQLEDGPAAAVRLSQGVKQSVRIMYCFIYRVSVLLIALYAECPYYVVLYMQMGAAGRGGGGGGGGGGVDVSGDGRRGARRSTTPDVARRGARDCA